MTGDEEKLKRIALDVCLSKDIPTAYEALSEDEFNCLMNSAAKSYVDGKIISLGESEDFIKIVKSVLANG